MVRPPDNGETCCTMKYGHLGKALALVHLGDEVRMASDESLVYQTFNSKPSFTFGYVDEGHIRILHLTILPRLRNTVHSPQKTSYTSPPDSSCLVLPINAGHRQARGKIATVIVAVSEDLVLLPYPCLLPLPQVDGMILVGMLIIKETIGGMTGEMKEG